MVSPSEAVVPQSDYLAPGQGQQDFVQQGFQEMDTSKIDASYVALKRVAGYPADHGPGLLVEAVGTGVPAEGKIRTGDVITAVNGTEITDDATLSKTIRGAGYGAPLRFTLKEGPKTKTVVVTTAHIPGVPYPAVGIATVPNFPFDVRINSQGIGGPSAGLMWTLGLIDVLTPGDLTGGAKIAGTGTIDPSGRVGPIGGVEQKVVAAERPAPRCSSCPWTTPTPPNRWRTARWPSSRCTPTRRRSTIFGPTGGGSDERAVPLTSMPVLVRSEGA